MEAGINGRFAIVGKPGWFKTLGLNIEEAENKIRLLQSESKTVMVVAVENELCGLISAADQVKAESAEAVRQLQKQDIEVIMLTGDNLMTAETIASNVNIHKVFAEVKPDERDLTGTPPTIDVTEFTLDNGQTPFVIPDGTAANEAIVIYVNSGKIYGHKINGNGLISGAEQHPM